MTDQLNFGNSAALLRANGYVPAACADNGKPIGPWAIRQHAFDRYPENDPLPVAVLTAVPAPRFELDPVQDHKATWLATLNVRVRDEAAADVMAVIATFIGAAKCPVRIGDDGSLLYVFRTGELFDRVQTTDASDFARADAGPSFIPLEGNWRGGHDLLDVQRTELPELSLAKAQALISAVGRVLQDHAEPMAPPAPYVRRPLLEPGERLLYGNRRAMDVLREHGFRSLVPVRWGRQESEGNGYSDSMGNWHYNVDTSGHGVGLALKGFVTLESGLTSFRPDVDEAIRALGPCLVRTVPGREQPLYVFRCLMGGGDEVISTPPAFVNVRRSGVVVLTGMDANGRECEWSRDLLTVLASELAAFEQHDGSRLRRALESLPMIDSKPAKRRKTAA